MATSFILLINNIVIRDEKEKPIYEVQDGGVKKYLTEKCGEDLSSRVEEVIEEILNKEYSNPLYELVTQTNNVVRYNQEFRIKMITTPLYDLQIQLATTPKISRIAGSSVNVAQLWEDQMYNFYISEFTKYTQIITYLETMVRAVRHPKQGPFSVRFEDYRMMNILYVEVNGLFNPLDMIGDLKSTKLFQQVYKPDSPISSTSLDDPAIFRVEIMRGTVGCYFATSSDIMKLCGVNHKEALSSQACFRLISGIIIKKLFGNMESSSLSMNSLRLPISKILFRAIDTESKKVVRYFDSSLSATEFADEHELAVSTLDTDINFISDAFPSFRSKKVNEQTPLLREIRGAEFEY